MTAHEPHFVVRIGQYSLQQLRKVVLRENKILCAVEEFEQQERYQQMIFVLPVDNTITIFPDSMRFTTPCSMCIDLSSPYCLLSHL
ncbi:hypothetical protein TNCV_42611 [Trichonephila clavipes]|nr:hypothetical protein TNCV_42611 [Trichonephila clavipes]